MSHPARRPSTLLGPVLASMLTTGCAMLARMPIFGDYETAMRARDRGNYDAAEFIFNVCVQNDPLFKDCWIGLAEVKLNVRNDFKGAAENASKAIEIDPNYGWAYYTRGRARLAGMDLSTARQKLNAEQVDLQGAISDMTKAMECGV